MPSPGTGWAAWNTYVGVTDAEATATRVTAAGGRVLVPPVDVQGQGRMAMFADDQGALVAAWQPGAFHGAGLVNEPGCFCWSELACRDTAAASTFYGSVFGWATDTSQLGPMTYTEWRLGGRAVGGMVHMDENWPGGIPPRWVVYFAVTDCDGARNRTGREGSGAARRRPAGPPGRHQRPAGRHADHHQTGRGGRGRVTPRRLTERSGPAPGSPPAVTGRRALSFRRQRHPS
jgi:predicted enzyme related to lactoylglutathione lyase